MYKHQCIKPGCDNTYEDEEVDAYYCASCQEEKLAIAKEIDRKHAGRDRNAKSDLQIFQEQAIERKKPDGTSIFIMKG